jgi:hypothetical protein
MSRNPAVEEQCAKFCSYMARRAHLRVNGVLTQPPSTSTACLDKTGFFGKDQVLEQ